MGPVIPDPDLKAIRDVTPSAPGCEDCLRIGSRWVHLRLCLTCGHVGCCDSFRISTPESIFTKVGIRSSSPSSQERIGAGATSTKRSFNTQWSKALEGNGKGSVQSASAAAPVSRTNRSPRLPLRQSERHYLRMLLLANTTQYGLTGVVFTRDLARGSRFAERMHVGRVARQ